MTYDVVFHAGALEGDRGLFEQHQQPVQPRTNLTFIGSVKETDEYYAVNKKSRERAPKVQTTQQVLILTAGFSCYCYDSDSAFLRRMNRN